MFGKKILLVFWDFKYVDTIFNLIHESTLKLNKQTYVSF